MRPQAAAQPRKVQRAEPSDSQLKGYSLEQPPRPSPAHFAVEEPDALDSEQEADIQQAVQLAMSREAALHPNGRVPSNAPLGVDYDSDDDHPAGVVDFWRPPVNAPPPSRNAAAKRALEKKQARNLARQQRRRPKVPGMTMPLPSDLVHPGAEINNVDDSNVDNDDVDNDHNDVDSEEGNDEDNNKKGDDEDNKRKGNHEDTPGGAMSARASGFASCGISSALATHLASSGFPAPSPIQAQAIPAVLVRACCLCLKHAVPFPLCPKAHRCVTHSRFVSASVPSHASPKTTRS